MGARGGPLRTRLRLGLGRGARAADRVQLASLLACLLLAVGVVPVALAVASVVGADAGARAAREAAERVEVPAVVLADAAPPPVSATGGRSTAPARWTAADGGLREGTVPVPPGTVAGERVPVWTGPGGLPADAPLASGSVVTVTVVAGTLTLLLGLAAAAAVHAGVCALLDRARDRAWARGWAEVEPEWAARFRLR